MLKDLSRLTQRRVLVVGDVMLDHYVTGTVERISPEAPVPIIRGRHETDMVGGAGNVLRNLWAIGAAAGLVGTVGGDRAGERIAELVRGGAADRIELICDASRPTTLKTRFIADRGQPLLRLDWEDDAPLGPETNREVLRHALDAIDWADGLVLSDYGKGILAGDTAPALIAAARGRGLPIVVDPKGDDWERYRGASYITPNRAELRLAARLPGGASIEALIGAAREMVARFDLGGILLTLSEHGMAVVRAGDAEPRLIPTRARDVSDVSGAGDTVVALFAQGLATGLEPVEAAELANVAAGIVVGKIGAATATPAEIADAIGAGAGSDGSPGRTAADFAGEGKLHTRESVLEQAAAWSRQNLRVGFTNGCFDLVHPGHVRILAAARAACDRLVVGLNSDASVARLKGPSRPVQREQARAAVVAAFASVDAVVLFDEDTPFELIRGLMPNVLVKGADYAGREVVGADIVRACGGTLVLVPLAEGHSTSGLVIRAAAPAVSAPSG